MASALYLILCLGLMLCKPALMDYPMMVSGVDEAGIKLHRPDGTPVFLNAHAIASVREPLSTENGHAVIVFYSGATQTIQETVQEVIDLITLEGGH